MGSAKVKMNNAGARELLTSPEVAAYLESLAGQVAAAMDATAPVGATGNLAASHTVVIDEHRDRVVAHIGSDLDYALPIALGTGYMARALDAAGGP